jgi:hypothetical protein
MGLLNKLFGIKQTNDSTQHAKETETTQLQIGDEFISTGGTDGFKFIRLLTEEQRERIKQSTILLRTGQPYMHYWTDNLICNDRNDPAWQNKVMFFWKAGEPFPRKSLPPEFETFAIKTFLFTGDTSKISVQVAQAMPWFGMPGLGEKHVCERNGQKVSIPELHTLGFIEYFETEELTKDNLHILTNREDYFFLVDERVTPFQNGNFYLKDKPISIDLAYGIGGIHVIKRTVLA